MFSCQEELRIWCLEADGKLCSVVYEVLELLSFRACVAVKVFSCNVEVAVVELKLKLSARCSVV